MIDDAPLRRLPDGTVTQVGPLTGTVVWTVPGRASRPLTQPRGEPRRLKGEEALALCAFCQTRYLETTPEKSRLVDPGDGSLEELRRVSPEALFDTVAQFRRFGNLFEIVSAEYWRENYGFRQPADIVRWADDYLSTDTGRAHIERLVEIRSEASGTATSLEEGALDLVGGSHDVVVARRHVADGARHDDELAASGTLTPDEHAQYIAFTVRTLGELRSAQPHARYIAVFQNWLRPAGASFEHLHKQLVAIDEVGPQVTREVALLRDDPRLYQHQIADLAVREGLVVAANEHAVAFAGVGHRFPAFEVYSRSGACTPDEHSADEVRAMSDLVHSLHAATGVHVPTNEEWHYRPDGVDVPMPWRIVLKWRISTPAGFEGVTKVYVNTIDPWTLRERAVSALRGLRADGRIAASIRIGDEVLPGDTALGCFG